MVKDEWTPGMTDEDLTKNFQVQILPAHGERLLTPLVLPTSISPKILKFRFLLHMVRDNWPPLVWLTSISPIIFKFRFSLHMVRDDWPPKVWLTRIWPKILKFRFSLHLVTDDWPPGWPTSISHKILSSDLVCTWWKMIDPHKVWLTRIWPKILKFRLSLHMVRDDWPPWYDWPGSHLKF